MTEYHEPYEALSEEVRDTHRALKSLIEEIEAVDWYNQRVATTRDSALKAVLAHNRDEEIEHACMTLEWLRRNMSGWDEELRTYLFAEGDITEQEEAHGGQSEDAGGTASGDASGPGDLGIRDLRKGDE
ncbi:MAG: hypothetical protein GF328_11915 [Candidatus Latescibacteria bacterium]|nr:hypothetical protein [Candidatus Latescibacterota bacterium]